MGRLSGTSRSAALSTVLLTAVVGAAGCGAPPERPGQDQGGQEAEMPTREIAEVLDAHRDSLMAIPGVVGTGVGKCEDELCIAVMVARKSPELAERIPATLEGYKVDVRETGEFQARPDTPDG